MMSEQSGLDAQHAPQPPKLARTHVLLLKYEVLAQMLTLSLM
jgi:hypothetical protein